MMSKKKFKVLAVHDVGKICETDPEIQKALNDFSKKAGSKKPKKNRFK